MQITDEIVSLIKELDDNGFTYNYNFTSWGGGPELIITSGPGNRKEIKDKVFDIAVKHIAGIIDKSPLFGITFEVD